MRTSTHHKPYRHPRTFGKHGVDWLISLGVGKAMGAPGGQHGWFSIDEMIGWEADLETDPSDHCKATQMQISSRIKQVEDI